VSSLEDYVISRRGADYILYEGLLAEGHKQGLKGIRKRLVQAPSTDNGGLAVCAAVVATSGGSFSGLGEARVMETRRTVATEAASREQLMGLPIVLTLNPAD
jgi:hypothetical protein